MDVAGWLQNLGLGQYASAFAENAIDIDVLSELSEHDLERLGIPLGHRKRLVRAIREMAIETRSIIVLRFTQVGLSAGSRRATAW